MDLTGLLASDLDSSCFFKESPAQVELFLTLSGRANGNTVAKSGSSGKLCAEVAANRSSLKAHSVTSLGVTMLALGVCSRVTGNPEVIASSVGLVPANALAVTDRLLAKSRLIITDFDRLMEFFLDPEAFEQDQQDVWLDTVKL